MGRRHVAIRKIFYNFVEELLKNSKISETEIEQLKTKAYTKSLFRATDYPAIANNRNDNMGNSYIKRYRAKELNFNNTAIYISTQFFETYRNAIIEWYKNHLN